MGVKVTKTGLNNLKRNIKSLNGATVDTGFFGGVPRRDGFTNATIAMWQEYGVEEVNIPERPFMSSTYLRNRNYKAQVRVIARDILLLKTSTSKSLNLLGKMIAKDMLNTLWNWHLTDSNAPSTIKKKGFDYPLVETTTLANNIKSRTRGITNKGDRSKGVR